MADSLPPPYSELEVRDDTIGGPASKSEDVNHVGFRRLASQPVQQIPVSSLSSYKSRHKVYISTIARRDQTLRTSIDASGNLLSAYHILPPLDSLLLSAAEPAAVLCAQHFDLEDLKMVSGFQDLGSFFIMQGHTFRSDDKLGEEDIQEVHGHLVRWLYDAEVHEQSNPAEPPTPMFETRTAPNHAFSNPSDPAVLDVHVFSMHLFTKDMNEESGPAKDIGTTRASQILFKWAKPQSVYGNLSGSWQASLVDVINDGVRNAGRELMLLARGVSDQQMRELQAIWQEGTRVMEF